MASYDQDYYFIRKPRKDPKVPFLVPDANTENRHFENKPEPVGSPPLVFLNGYKKENKKSGINARTTDIMFVGADFIVSTAMRDKLVVRDLPNVFMHPAIYIDDKDKWHEDYWFLTFPETFDCWDRKTSRYDKEAPIEVDDEKIYGVSSYRLDPVVMEKTPLEKRLLFKMGGDLSNYIVCHQSLLSIFRAGGDSGANILALSEQ